MRICHTILDLIYLLTAIG